MIAPLIGSWGSPITTSRKGQPQTPRRSLPLKTPTRGNLNISRPNISRPRDPPKILIILLGVSLSEVRRLAKVLDKSCFRKNLLNSFQEKQF